MKAFAQTGSDISETLQGIARAVFLYDGVDDLTRLLEEMIHYV